MRICFLGLGNLPVLAREYNHHGTGGAQVQMTLLAKALVKRGYEVSMVVGDYGQEDGRAWEGVTTYKAFKHNEGLPIIRFIHPRWTKTWAALGRSDADVYVTSCAGMHVGLLALYCNRMGKGFVFRLANDGDADPRHVLIQTWRDKKLYEFGLRRADRLLCQNNLQRKRLKDNYSLSAAIIRSFVEASVLVRPLQERRIELLWVSNLRDIKRPGLAVDLARSLPHRHLHMVGGPLTGAAKLYDNIQREAATLTNLTFHGAVPYHEVSELYDRARVFINTSSSEGFPNSYLQSWQRGVPVIAFLDPDGLIQREGLGYAVSGMDEMRQASERLLSDDSEWQRASDRCRVYMDRHHGDDIVLKPYILAIEKAHMVRCKSRESR
ncbi:glycosyltransferase family 4 protein [Rhabdochromatium marinum]|uniref:glycosyltransferase family 4 protein n=1 Tax=Rhabdochromatium marinum TaxID=48729 RepID=UPI0023DF48A3|nr:glycosyltransferase family 4 protein [Rhabdochromatium marinum]MBK1647108.1 hypothetical protein [Rhabdochromatium marinum]